MSTLFMQPLQQPAHTHPLPLGEYNIVAGGTIHMVLQLRGGL